jgi:NTE family protein
MSTLPVRSARALVWLAFALPLAMLASPARAAESPQAAVQSSAKAAAPASRPRTCLVLSGGGARGAAHIGVLKVLERERVPIDCVVGTSMGAIIGGAWASGVPAEQIEIALRAVRWNRVLSDDPDRPQRSVRAKDLERRRFGAAEFGYRDGAAVLPRGAVIGQQFEFFLAQLYGVATRRDSFDELPIPFRALATDIESGRLVVLDRGSLNEAVRASMSVPGVFSPKEVGGRLLVDGGLVRNLGIDVARSLGAERVIAVNLGTPLAGRETLDSLLGVTGQMIAILTEQNVERSLSELGAADLLISPALGEFSAADFAGAPDVIPLGEAAASEVAARLAGFSAPEPDWLAWRDSLRRRQTELPVFETITVDTTRLQRVDPASAQAVFEASFRSGPAETALERAIDALYATDDFQQISVRSAVSSDGLDALVIEPREKSWGPNYVRLGLTLATDLEGESAFTVLADHRATWLNRRGLELRSTASVGQLNSLRSELFQPLDLARRWSVSAAAAWQQRIDEAFVDDTAVARFRQSALRGSLDLGRQIGTVGELRLGIERERLSSRIVTGSAGSLDTGSRSTSSLFTRMTIDTLDSWDFPRRGWFLRSDFELADPALGGDIDYRRLSLEWQGARGGTNYSLSTVLRYEDSLGTQLPLTEAFVLGGFENLSGLRERQILANQVLFGRVVYSRQIGRGGALLRGVYLGGSIEYARVRERLNALDPTFEGLGGSLFLSLDSRLGPFYLGAGLAEEGEATLYLFLGRP